MRKSWPYILLLAVVLFVLFRVSRKVSRHQVDWTESYTSNSRIPLGCFVATDYLDEMMSGETETVDRTVYQQLADSSYKSCNYVFVNSQFEPSMQDMGQLLKFAGNGNTVLISARSFGFLADTLHVGMTDPLYYEMDTGTVASVVAGGANSVQANLFNPKLKLQKNAVFGHTTIALVFAAVDTVNTTVLGADGNDHVNFIRVRVGKGQFLLHTLPDAFGNYYATEKSTADYLFRVLSYLPKQRTFIDAHYKAGRVENEDTRRYLFAEPALKLAYLALIVTGFIALLFGGKRRQRPVPVVAPHTNSTLEFVEQVGALYYRQGNHADIAHKKIAYFLESVRSRFYIQTHVFDERFLDRITNISGVPPEQVRHLFSRIDNVRATNSCTDKELKALEQLIRDFNQRSKR